jgi:hypothetical protein
MIWVAVRFATTEKFKNVERKRKAVIEGQR